MLTGARLEKSPRISESKIHTTSAAPNVNTHPLATPRVRLVHQLAEYPEDGWFRIPWRN